MRSLTSLALLGLVVGCSPAVAPVETPKAPPPVKVDPKPEQTHASWSFPDAVGEVNAQVDLGDRGILQVGERGRRWLFAKGETEAKQATTLVEQDLVDARIEGAQVVLLGEQGAVYVAKEPLGAIETTRPGPKDHKAFAFRAGKQALLGVDRVGTLYRSIDAGVTWAESKLPMRPGDVVVGLAANARGEALALIHPQRLLLSNDDGVSFAPLGTPGIGARAVRRDAKGDLFLEGVGKDKSAKLANGKLDLATPAQWTQQKGKSEGRKRHEIAGNRIVTVTNTPEGTSKEKIEVAVSAFGKEPGAPFLLQLSPNRYGTRVLVGGYENTVVVGFHDERTDPPTTKVMRTNDDGKTWDDLGTLSGRLGYEAELSVAAGHVMIGEICDDDANTCKPAQIKHGSAPWKEVVVPAKTRIDRVQLDPAHDRAWLIGSTNDKSTLFSGKLSDGTFTPTGIELPGGTPMATTIDGKGALRLVYSWPSRILRVGSDSTMQPPTYLPFEIRAIGFAGERAYAYDGKTGWETADAGEKWTKVATGSTDDVACSDVGCVQGGAVRIGWDLPDPARELVAATAEPPKKKEGDAPSAPAPIAQAPQKMTCTVGGAWKAYDGEAWQLRTAYDGDVRFLTPSQSKDGATSVLVARGSGAPTKVALLGPWAKKKPDDNTRERGWTERTNEGYVSLRYAFSPGKSADGKYAPVDVDLAWYSAASGKATKTTLAKVAPFRVGRAAPSALHAIVEGGLLFMPNSGDAPLTFVRDGGKQESMPRPPQPDQGSWTDAIKHGNEIVLVRQRSGDVTFAQTKDAGKTWSTTSWSLGAPVSVNLLDGKITLAMRHSLYGGGSPPSALFSFDTLTNDPPDALRLDPTRLGLGSSLAACTPKMRLGLMTEVGTSKDRRGMIVTIAPDKKPPAKKPVTEVSGPLTLSLERLVDRIDASGNVCNDGVALRSEGSSMVTALIAPHDLAHGWLIRAETSNKLEARPISCKPE